MKRQANEHLQTTAGTCGHLWLWALSTLDVAEAEDRQGPLGILRKSGPQFQTSESLITQRRDGFLKCAKSICETRDRGRSTAHSLVVSGVLSHRKSLQGHVGSCWA